MMRAQIGTCDCCKREEVLVVGVSFDDPRMGGVDIDVCRLCHRAPSEAFPACKACQGEGMGRYDCRVCPVCNGEG